MKTLLIVFLLAAAMLHAQESPKTWEFNGDVQLRGELDGRDFYNTTYPLYVTTMRTRIGVTRTFGEKVTFFAQFQDSRTFGQGITTSAYLANVDMHQVYLRFNDVFALPLDIQAGRFKYSFGNERLFGNSDWGPIGRSYDGLLLSLDMPWKTDFIIANIHEVEKYVSNATPGSYVYPALRDSSVNMIAVTVKGKLNESNTLSLEGYYESDRKVPNGIDQQLARYTLGAEHNYIMKPFSTVVEFIYQGGTIGAKDVSAYLVSVSAAYSMGTSKFTPGIDLLSGTNPTELTKYNSFDAAFGTGHKFYGFMDYFTSIPSNTGNLGLQDIFLNYDYAPENSPFLYSAAFHHLASAEESAAGESVFGQELDLTIRYTVTKGVNLFWGGSVFLPGELMKTRFAKGGNTELDPSFWSYLMIKAAL
ncbi:MAG: alginate export family protein [Ignavibacteriaceae bacterium]|nr:alginate export family protein [Ignavibacteriaceae bacterium]